MAGDVYSLLSEHPLPDLWDYGVAGDGRVFFIDDASGTTTWLHPTTGEPVQTGHNAAMHLPRGWEEGTTPEGIKYYIDHNARRTTFVNPVTGHAEACEDLIPYWEHSRNGHQQGQVPFRLRQMAAVDPADPSVPGSAAALEHHGRTVSSLSDGGRPERGPASTSGYGEHAPDASFYQPDDSVFREGINPEPRQSHARWSSSDDIHKVHAWHQHQQQHWSQPAPGRSRSSSGGGGGPLQAHHDARSDHSSNPHSKAGKQGKSKKKLAAPGVRRRRPDAPVAMKGWLYKLESGGTGLKMWRKRYCVLSEFCLFFYKDDREDGPVSSSILLPSYSINPVTAREDGITRKFAFKAEHGNMKTYYFATDGKEELSRWMNAMSLASILQRDPVVEQEFNRTDGDGMPAPTKSGSTATGHHTDADDSRGGGNPGSSIAAWQEQQPHHHSHHQHRGPGPGRRQHVSDPEWQWPQPHVYSAAVAADHQHNHHAQSSSQPDRWPPTYHSSIGNSQQANVALQNFSLSSYEGHHSAPSPGDDVSGTGPPVGGYGWQASPSNWGSHEARGSSGQWDRPAVDKSHVFAPGHQDQTGRTPSLAPTAPEPRFGHTTGSVQRLHTTGDYENFTQHHRQEHPPLAPSNKAQLYVPSTLPGPAFDQRPFADTNPFRSSAVIEPALFPSDRLPPQSNQQSQQQAPLAPWQQQSSVAAVEVAATAPIAPPPSTVDEPPWRRANKQVPSYRPPAVSSAVPMSGSERSAETPLDKPLVRSPAVQASFSVNGSFTLDGSPQQQQHDQLDYVNISPPAAFSSSPAAVAAPIPGDGMQHGSTKSATPSGEYVQHVVPSETRSNAPVHLSRQYQTSAMPDVTAAAGANMAASPTRSSSSKRGQISFTTLTAEELSGKSHEQLVLLLIELRRQLSQAEAARDAAQARCQRAHGVLSLAHSSNSAIDAVLHRKEADELAGYIQSIDEQIEAQKPVIAMVDNLVRLGSPHGVQNAEMADRLNRNLLRRREPSLSEQYSGSTPAQQSGQAGGQVVHGRDFRGSAAGVRDHSISSSTEAFEVRPLMRNREEVETALREQHALLGTLTFAQRQMEDKRSDLLEQLRHATRELRSLPPRITEQLDRLDAELTAGDRRINSVTKNLEELALRHAELEKEADNSRSRLAGDGMGHPAVTSDSRRAQEGSSYHRDVSSTASNGMPTGYGSGGVPVGYKLNGGRNDLQSLPFEAYRDLSSAPTAYSLPPVVPGTYFETDLDTMVTRDIAIPSSVLTQPPDSTESSLPAVGEWDIGEADDSTKRFFGILPREKARSATTVRDVKRAAALRFEQQKDVGAVDEVPAGLATANQYRPTPSGPSSSSHVQGRNTGQLTAARLFSPARLPTGATSSGPGSGGGVSSMPPWCRGGPGALQPAAASTDLPPAVPPAFRGAQAGFRRMNNGRVRYLTISSSQPLSFESATLRGGKAVTVPEGTQDRFAESTMRAAGRPGSFTAGADSSFVTPIDVELSAPQKVVIPERYVPDADDAAELTDEEKRARALKAERLRKMLSAQSLQEWTRAEISPAQASESNRGGAAVSDRLVVEKKRRETVLEMRHMLAMEVSLKTREAAAAQKLRCRSQESLPRLVNSEMYSS